MTYLLLISVFLIASSGLIYELVAAALASYLLGDSVTQFSTIIGTYLFAMGVGSYLSQFIGKGLVARFIAIELLIGLIGGSSAAILFLTFAYVGTLKLLLYTLVFFTGAMVGLEIPLLIRILKDHLQFKDLVAQVLTFDYIGALLVSLLFPILLAPKLGLIRTCFLFGLVNVLVASWTVWLFRDQLTRAHGFQVACFLTALPLLAGFAYADRMTTLAEENLYTDEIVFTATTPYQRIVITRWRDDLSLFLNGHQQFSSRDEYRYHEALVHPGLQAIPHPRRVLVLGGGDGLAIREILKYPSVETITLVDLDPEMTKLFSTHPGLTALNQGSLRHPMVKVINADAFVWLEENTEFFDFIVVDFPDPTSHSLSKLYTSAFYKLLRKRVSEHGMVAIQATSPLYARASYWCIVKTVESVGFHITPYHAYVPSFGEWGFVIASQQPYTPPTHYPSGLRFLTPAIAPTLFEFPNDMQPVAVEVNRLSNQVLTQYYEAEWGQVLP